MAITVSVLCKYIVKQLRTVDRILQRCYDEHFWNYESTLHILEYNDNRRCIRSAVVLTR